MSAHPEIYSPLSPAASEIRILSLHPGTASAPIKCTTTTISLNTTHTPYEALSYVWGAPSAESSPEITINSQPSFPVTRNLYTALNHLRYQDKPRTLWIDALCIDQSNVQERNQQVAIMDRIYALAEPVLVWLGEGSEESDEGFDLVGACFGGVGNADKREKEPERSIELTDQIERTLFAFFMNLVQRTWFTRLWTVQEVVLAARDPLVGCGFKWLCWSTLVRAWKRVAMNEFERMGMVIEAPIHTTEKESRDGTDEDRDAKLKFRPGSIKLDLLNNLRAKISTARGEDLRDLLLNTHSSQATEARDRIFALRGMMQESDRDAITVDYSRPVGTIFAEAVAHLFQKGQGPFVLSGMALAGSGHGDASFPSWVPVFGSPSLLTPTPLHPPGIGVSGAGSAAVNGRVDEDLQRLRVRGMLIDIVAEKMVFEKGLQCLQQLPQVELLVKKARELAARNVANRPYLNKFKSKEPLWRTLVANKRYSGGAREVAPIDYEDMYAELLRHAGGTGSDSHITDKFIRDYKLSLLNRLPSNSFFVTETGFVGIGQAAIQEGDHLAIWFGAPAPFILRKKALDLGGEQEAVYTVHGIAYVAGIMDGEMVDEVYCEDLEDDIVFVVE